MQHNSPKRQNKISDFNGKLKILRTIVQEGREQTKVLHNLTDNVNSQKPEHLFCIRTFDSNNIREKCVDNSSSKSIW